MNTAAAKLLYEMEYGRDTVLTVITEQEDSAPRGSGSFMLVGQSGRLLGTIGGGAVEKRSEELAAECLKEKKSAVHVFHLKPNTEENIGMVCGGDVTVLFRYICGKDETWRSIASAILDIYHSRRDGWIVLSISGDGAAVTDSDGRVIAGSGIDSLKVPEGRRCIQEGGCFYYPLRTGERAVLFGAGHCGKALAPILDSVGFRVVIFDNRQEFADPGIYTFAEAVICGDYENISDSISLDPGDYIVIMTSGHAFDCAVERQVLQGEKAYVGVIGSAKKTAAVNRRLIDAGISPDMLREVYTPIGLDIRAVTPEEIAVSIAGEMIRVRANRREGLEDHPPADKKVH